MRFRVGAGEQVVADAQAAKQIEEAGMVMLVDFQIAQAHFLGLDRHRRAVAVGAGDHQHVVASQAVGARIDVARQMGTGDIALMNIGVGVGPGNAYQHKLSHRLFDLVFFVLFVLFDFLVLVFGDLRQRLGQQFKIVFADAIEGFVFDVELAEIGVAFQID